MERRVTIHNHILSWLLAGVFLASGLSGCTTLNVPYGGTGNVTVIEGGLVETIAFAGGAQLNIQITEEQLPDDEFLFSHVLTIGRFSPVLGSGFTKRSNIYYESRVGSRGHDFFDAGGERYVVFWELVDELRATPCPKSIFSVTIARQSQATQDT